MTERDKKLLGIGIFIGVVMVLLWTGVELGHG